MAPIYGRAQAKPTRPNQERFVVGEVSLGGMRVPLHRFGGITPARDASGDIESMSFLAGQCVGLVNEIKPAAEIVREVVVQMERILKTIS